ncbi:MAG: hypothetical protein ACQUYJ_12555 [Ferruginibacter sp.]
MSINLLETVQQHLGYPVLHKIDPNTQQVTGENQTPDENKFSQAAIPAVLTAIYKYVQADEGATQLLQGDDSVNWIDKIFNDHKKEAIQIIASYAKQSGEDPVAKMNAIATETVKIVKTHLPENAGIKEVKAFFKNQKATILLYLPADLNMGELLHDNTLDDNTNKMEGPVSSLIQSIGAAFSTNATEEEIKSK